MKFYDLDIVVIENGLQVRKYKEPLENFISFTMNNIHIYYTGSIDNILLILFEIKFSFYFSKNNY